MHVVRLRISGVRGFYGDRAVDLDLTRPDGSLAGWTVLAGRNGSGKSSLLQALALTLAGQQSIAFVPSLTDWMSHDVTRAEARASLQTPRGPREAWMEFVRPEAFPQRGGYEEEPELDGAGIDSFALRPHPSNHFYTPFYVGYGPFRHLGGSQQQGSGRSRYSKRSQRLASLFDETAVLADAIEWLIEQHLYQLEGNQDSADFLEFMLTLLSDGLLPDRFEVRKVDSKGLWVRNNGSEFPLQGMSDGFRTATALVVDIIRQLAATNPYATFTMQGSTPVITHPGVVLIDEADAHLHVIWQKKIGTWLKEHFPQIQFIVTTHSPYICQSADPGGLISLPGPHENRPPRVVDEDLYHRVVYGSGDDAVLSELFGIETPYSPAAEKLRERLGDLEIKVLDGAATADEKEEYREISDMLSSSLSTRADEVAKRLRREG